MQDIVDLIDAFCRQHPAQFIFEEAQKRQLPWSKVRSPDEVAADAHLHARGFYQRVELFPGEQVQWPGLAWQGLPSALLDACRAGGSVLRRPVRTPTASWAGERNAYRLCPAQQLGAG